MSAACDYNNNNHNNTNKEHDALHEGRFGFPVSNFLALTPLNNSWCDSWTEFFKRRMADQIDGLVKVSPPPPAIRVGRMR